MPLAKGENTMEIYSHKEILRALNIIREICQNTSCSKCPFFSGIECEITLNTPDDWDIKNEDETTWRAFL